MNMPAFTEEDVIRVGVPPTTKVTFTLETTWLLMLWKEMPSFIATLSLKLRGIEEYDNLTFQTEPSVINFIFRDGLPAD